VPRLLLGAVEERAPTVEDGRMTESFEELGGYPSEPVRPDPDQLVGDGQTRCVHCGLVIVERENRAAPERRWVHVASDLRRCDLGIGGWAEPRPSQTPTRQDLA
jgi:hypothetical protein